jgi:hypothetical protein
MFEWAEQYPKLCSDCSRAWRAVMSQRYHAGKGVASGLKFIEAHPMKSAEEFGQFSIIYSGRDKAKPEPEQQQEPELGPEEGGRGRRKMEPVQRFAQGISRLETMNLFRPHLADLKQDLRQQIRSLGHRDNRG